MKCECKNWCRTSLSDKSKHHPRCSKEQSESTCTACALKRAPLLDGFCIECYAVQNKETKNEIAKLRATLEQVKQHCEKQINNYDIRAFTRSEIRKILNIIKDGE